MTHQALATRPAVPSTTVPPKFLTKDELEALKSVRMNPRDRALIAVLSQCGLRVSEACALAVDNIDWSTATPSLRFADKRGKERVVPMNLEVQDVLREWLASRRFSDSEYVFCNLRNGQQLSRKTVWAFMKTYAQRAGIRHVHPHMLRHTFGADLADRDVPVERIKDLMGHSSIEASSIYISVSDEQKRRTPILSLSRSLRFPQQCEIQGQDGIPRGRRCGVRRGCYAAPDIHAHIEYGRYLAIV